MERKRATRSQAAAIEIPDCVDPERRERCLADPVLFLRTYMADRYTKPFDEDHLFMIDSIHKRAKYGGRQSIAAPRGRGKSEVCKGMLIYLVAAGLVKFPVVVASTSAHAQKIYKDFRQKWTVNDMLYEDFPEICHPIRELDGAPQRASKQHVDGKLTQIVWSSTGYLSFPKVPMPKNLGDGPSAYGDVKMAYAGLDAAIRGLNIDGCRPSFCLIDDPESEESARSLGQIETRSRILDQDLAGLAEQGEQLAMVCLTTVQNRYCLSFQLTDRKQRGAWNGVRFGLIKEWPERMDLWETYISKRHKGQAEGDPYGLDAVDFYIENKETMHKGCEMLTDTFTATALDDGTVVTHTALQYCFDKIADTSMESFLTEYQNDPAEEEEISTLGLTAAKVQQRTNLLHQNELPRETEHITLGLDLGKYASHWVKIAWQDGCIGTVIDYGVMETVGLSHQSNTKDIENALLHSLELYANEQLEGELKPSLCLVDSGTFTNAPYQFHRQIRHTFYCAKGWDMGRFRMPVAGKEKRPFDNCYASWQQNEQLWLYNVNTEHWKYWLQERFMMETYDDECKFIPGSMSLFNNNGDTRKHLSFAKHMVSEELRMVPVFGKELKREWFICNRNNHYLDAAALACAAAGCLGVKILDADRPEQRPIKQVQQKNSQFARGGRPFLVTERR